MKSSRFYLTFVVALLTILIACAPKATPAPVPVSGLAVTPGSADIAWQKVIQDAKKEGKLSVYSFNLTGDVGTAVTKAVREKLGIEMEVVTGPGAQLVERIKSERRSGQYLVDVMDGSPALVVQSKQEGSTIRWPEIPVLKEKDAWKFQPVLDKDSHLMWWIPIIYMPYYNTNLVKADEVPKSWNDFLAPKWKGKLAISNPDTIASLNRFYTIMTSRGVLPASYFQELAKQELRFYPTFRDDIAATARGEVAIDLSSAGMVANTLIKQGAPLRPFDITEGLTASGAVVVNLQNAPHPNDTDFIVW